MSTEHRWSDTDREKRKYSYPENNSYLCHFDQHKSQMIWPGTEAVPSR